jgi:hypothetical protein
MIHVLFVPGMFGSTIEYVLRSYTQQYTKLDAHILNDGSMHSYCKQAHLLTCKDVEEFFGNSQEDAITTPIYPFNNQHLPEILVELDKYTSLDDSFVIVYADSLQAAELNVLFQYHKIADGTILKKGLEIFCGNNTHNILNWNADYTHWNRMQPWEIREWFSMFYVDWCSEWQNSQHQVLSKFAKIKNTDILNDPYSVFARIIKHCGLTEQAGLEEFSATWKQAQQYIIEEYNLLGNIVESTVSNQPLSWEPINIIAEAIVQQRLRALGYEIRCDGLNTFPTDSKTLYNLLEKV